MASTPPPLPFPPRAPVAFRVGVVGHRLDRLPADPATLAALQARLGEVLGIVRDEVARFAADAPLYAREQARLTAVSPLAEGSDRLFAAAADALDYALVAPMPFFQAEFESDFDARSTAEFRALLARFETRGALTRFELDGSRADAPGAYAAAGRVVLNQSDLLVAVWDGAAARGRGGTAETVGDALRYRVPVLWIRPEPPFAWSLAHTASDHGQPVSTDPVALRRAVAELVTRELTLPAEPASESLAKSYFGEKTPPRYRHWFWKSFRNLVGGGGPVLPRPRSQDFVEEELAAEPDGDATLIGHFAWADRLADFYADAHRSNVVIGSLLSVVAVLLGILPVIVHLEGHREHGWLIAVTAMELIVVVALAQSFRRARARRWHEKWLEYRTLAEWIRQLRFLTPLGGGRPLVRARAHLATYGDPLGSWMYWQVRAIARARAVPNAVATPAHLAACLGDVADTIRGQIGFHSATMHRSERIRERLHGTTAWAVRIVIAAIAIHLAMLILDVEPPPALRALVDGVVLLCATFVPALGAALANINNQGEFARLTKRARAMRDTLARLGEEAAALAAGNASLGQVSSLAERMAGTMLEEVVDWRVVVLDPPQGLE